MCPGVLCGICQWPFELAACTGESEVSEVLQKGQRDADLSLATCEGFASSSTYTAWTLNTALSNRVRNLSCYMPPCMQFSSGPRDPGGTETGQGPGRDQQVPGSRIPPGCPSAQAAPADASSVNEGQWSCLSGGGMECEVKTGTDTTSNGVIYFSPGHKVWQREGVCCIKEGHSFTHSTNACRPLRCAWLCGQVRDSEVRARDLCRRLSHHTLPSERGLTIGQEFARRGREAGACQAGETSVSARPRRPWPPREDGHRGHVGEDREARQPRRCLTR